MKKTVTIVIISLLLVSLTWYFVSPLFIDKTINEDLPIATNQDSTKSAKDDSLIYQGQFIGADSFHKVTGKAIVLEENGKRYLRFEDFESTNGPDLKVYLAENTGAESYVSLGELKGNIGNQNYEIPANTDLEKNNKVLIWCEKFKVLFGHLELIPKS